MRKLYLVFGLLFLLLFCSLKATDVKTEDSDKKHLNEADSQDAVGVLNDDGEYEKTVKTGNSFKFLIHFYKNFFIFRRRRRIRRRRF